MNGKRITKTVTENLAEVRVLVEQLIDEKLNGKPVVPDSSFVGYNPIEKIRGALFWWIAVPFNRVDVWCQLRCPNATQIETCGDISSITQGDENRKLDYEELLQIRNFQEALCQVTFNKPTFNRIVSLANDTDFMMSDKKMELKRIKKQFEDNKNEMDAEQRNELETQIKTLELQLGFILPDDTMTIICKWAIGNDVSDIKKLNKEKFLRAASLARAYNKAPTDYLSGVFTDYNKKEIDIHAMMVLDEHLHEHKAVESGKFKWILGGKR